jgi:NDP-sugar pyrophosphorylase family protein
MSRRAVILAGGVGSRLRPYTVVLPKPMMPVGEYPILEIIVRQLAMQGFERITMAVNHQANIIKAFFENGDQWGVRIDYSLETKPLSTIAPLRLVDDLPQNFLLMNGDILTDLRLDQLYDKHVSDKRLFTIAASRRTHIIDYGVINVDSANLLSSFTEKPSMHYLVSMGVYVLNRDVLAVVPPDQKYGFDDLMRDLLARKERVHVEPYEGYWLDIGRPDDYMQAIDDFEARKGELLRP